MSTGGSSNLGSSTVVPSPTTIDVSTFLANPALLETFKLARPEPPEERASRLRRENITTYTQLTMEVVITIVVLIGIGYLCTILIGIASNPAASADAQKTAMAALSALVSGAGGYIFGKKSAK